MSLITHKLFQQCIKNLSEWEIEFLSSYFSEKCSNVYNIFINFKIEIINTTLSKLRMLQYFIAEQTFLNVYISYQS